MFGVRGDIAMTDVLLNARDLDTIDRLLTSSADYDGGDLLPDGVLRRLTELFTSAVAGISEIDRFSGAVLRTQTFPPGVSTVSVRSIRAAFPATHSRHVMHVFLARAQPPFTARDTVLFRLLAPSLHELAVGFRHRREVQGLSPSEVRVLALVAQGASNQEVSRSLSVSVATVRKHLEHIYAKLGVRNRTAAAARAFPKNFSR
jgi:DNA-binding CsgD family transcriptional regulator